MGSILDANEVLTEVWAAEDTSASCSGPSRGHLAVKKLMAVMTSRDPETHDWSNGALEASCDCLLRITVTHPQQGSQKKRPRGRPRKATQADGGGDEETARKKPQEHEVSHRHHGGEQPAARRNKRVRTQKRDPDFLYGKNELRNAEGNGNESDEDSTESDESDEARQHSGTGKGGRKRAKVEPKRKEAEAGDEAEAVTSGDPKLTSVSIDDDKTMSDGSHATKNDAPAGRFVMGWGSGGQRGCRAGGGNGGHRKASQVRYIRSHQWVLARASPAVLLPLIAQQLYERCRLHAEEEEGEGQLVTIDLTVHDESELEALSCLVRMLYTGDYGSDAQVASKHKPRLLGVAKQLAVFKVARRFEMKAAVASVSEALASKLGPHCVPVALECLTSLPYPTQPDAGEGGLTKLVLRAADVVAESLGHVHELWQGDRSLLPLTAVGPGEPHRKPGATCFDLGLKPHVTSLPLVAFKAVLRSDALQLKSENDAYWLMRAWLDAQPGPGNDTAEGSQGLELHEGGAGMLDEATRLLTYVELLSCLRLPRMTSSFLALIVARDPYLEASGQGPALLAQALWWRDTGMAMLQKSTGWSSKREKIAMGPPSRAIPPTGPPPFPTASPPPIIKSTGGPEQQWTFVSSFERVHADLCERSALGAFKPVGVVAGMPLLIQMQRRRDAKDKTAMLGVYAGLKLNPTPLGNKALEQWGGVCAFMSIEAKLMPQGDTIQPRVWGPYHVLFHAGDSEGSYWGAPSFFRWDSAWDATHNSANPLQLELDGAGSATPPAPPAPFVQVTVNITLPLAPTPPAPAPPLLTPPTQHGAQQHAHVSINKAFSGEKDRTPCIYTAQAGAGGGAVAGAGGEGPEAIFTPPKY